LPVNQAFPAFEWGLNWCVVSHINTYLLIHSGVLAKDDRIVLLPGEPAAGKSTLTAGLMLRGWRLFSDELALVEAGSNQLRPMVRPVNLKNDSIGIVRAFAPEAVLNKETPDTTKGVVSHLRPTAASVAEGSRPGRVAWVVFPRFTRGLTERRITRVSRPQAFMRLADLSFNYATLGLKGFETLRAVVSDAACFDFAFGSLDDGLAGIEAIAKGEVTGT
jgi:HprK-related kinase A